jgi:amino acid adenylation domain-containing protein
MKYLHSIWLKNADKLSEKIAVEDVSGRYTYSELSESSNNWFEYFKNNNIPIQSNVLIVANASFSSIALIIGCSLRGVIFTVLSPDTPMERVETIVDDIQPVLIISERPQLAEETSVCPIKFVENAFSITTMPLIREDAVLEIANSSLPAYVVYTSGSTGKPKGIVMSHRAIESFWEGLIVDAKLPLDARYASLSPLQFDFSLLDIGLCLGSGATLIIPNRANLKKPALMIEELAEKFITHFSSVPTIWKMFLITAKDSIIKLDRLKRISFAGEHFPKEHMCEIADILKDVDFYNIYGQSESIACTFNVINESGFRSSVPHLPVGKAHQDMNLFLLNENDGLVRTPNITAELYISGSTLFSGYWNMPLLTENNLIQNPLHNKYKELVFKTGDLCYFDEGGTFYFVGRKDNQIQINGNRVEIEEVESTIGEYPGVNNCCAFYSKNCLQAAVVFDAASKGCNSEEKIRDYLKNKLPSYMLVNKYHFISSIPFSSNGKNDRKQLVDLLTKDLVGV